MEFVTELHPHSKYAAACSDQLTLENMSKACETKGIQIMGTGDFTHPLWSKDIKEKLEEAEKGLYRVKGLDSKTRFILTSEVSIFFSKDKKMTGRLAVFDKTGSVKRFHNVIVAPNTEVMEQISSRLSKFGNLAADARPMLEISASELVETMHSISDEIMVFPAHAWTPWFGVFGSLSGFNSMKDAYEDQVMHIHALETGLSSDPSNNWRLSELDKFAIISGSDAHSLPKLGREATVLEMDEKDLSFRSITDSIKAKRIKCTIEFYPEEGKYHYDGHRKCGISLSPEEAKRYNNNCPKCGRKLTLGVLHRVDELADREPGYVPKNAVPFVHAIPLLEVIAFVAKKTVQSKYVQSAYEKLIGKFGTEMNVLLKATPDQISEIDEDLAKAIENVRDNRVSIKPGYDGVFGIIDILNAADSSEHIASGSYGQKTLS
jgi:uncharacterized protein (TIGR00375 family)